MIDKVIDPNEEIIGSKINESKDKIIYQTINKLTGILEYHILAKKDDRWEHYSQYPGEIKWYLKELNGIAKKVLKELKIE